MANPFSNLRSDLPTFLTLAALGSTAGAGAAYLNQRFGGGVQGTSYADDINTPMSLEDKSQEILEAPKAQANKKRRKKKTEDQAPQDTEKNAGIKDILRMTGKLGIFSLPNVVARSVLGNKGKAISRNMKKIIAGVGAGAGGLAAELLAPDDYKTSTLARGAASKFKDFYSSVSNPKYEPYSNNPKSLLELMTSRNMLKPLLASTALVGTGLGAYNLLTPRLDRNATIQSKIDSRIKEQEYEDFIEKEMTGKEASLNKHAGSVKAAKKFWKMFPGLSKFFGKVKKPLAIAGIGTGIGQGAWMGYNAYKDKPVMENTPVRFLTNGASSILNATADGNSSLFSIPAAVGLGGALLLSQGMFRDKKRDKRVAELKDKIDDVRVKNYVDHMRSNKRTEEDEDSAE